MTAVAELNAARREILFAIGELEGESGLTKYEISDAMLEDVRVGPKAVCYHLRELADDGLVRSTGRKFVNVRGPDPKAYRLTDAGRRELIAEADRRLEQLEEFEGLGEPRWQTVLERVDMGSDRLVDDAFCPRCGRIYAGEGTCDDCQDQIDGDVLADPGDA